LPTVDGKSGTSGAAPQATLRHVALVFWAVKQPSPGRGLPDRYWLHEPESVGCVEFVLAKGARVPAWVELGPPAGAAPPFGFPSEAAICAGPGEPDELAWPLPFEGLALPAAANAAGTDGSARRMKRVRTARGLGFVRLEARFLKACAKTS